MSRSHHCDFVLFYFSVFVQMFESSLRVSPRLIYFQGSISTFQHLVCVWYLVASLRIFEEGREGRREGGSHVQITPKSLMIG